MSIRSSFVVALMLAVGLAQTSAASGPPLVGAVANFELAASPAPYPDLEIAGADGTVRRLSELRQGGFALVNFWATWCAPCVKELPSLLRLKQAMDGPRFTVLTLSIDRGGAHRVEPFLKRYDIDGLGVHIDASGQSFQAMQSGVLPSTLLIGPDGRELGRYIGPTEWDAPEVEELMRYYLDGGVSTLPVPAG